MGDGVPPPSRVDVHDCRDQLSPHSWPLPWLSDGCFRLGRLPAISEDCEEPATVANEEGSQVLSIVASENCDEARVHTGTPASVGMEASPHTAVPGVAGITAPIDTSASRQVDHVVGGFLLVLGF